LLQEALFEMTSVKGVDMTHDERHSLFTNALHELMQKDRAMVIFNLAHDEDSFVQFSHDRSGETLLCEVSNRSEGWNAHSLDPAQVAVLRALGYEIPSPHHQSTPHKEYAGDLDKLADEVEKIFTQVFRAPQEYEVISSGEVMP
jgi:hypothetical protein